jgi:ribosomal-protein-alanine N-acetyltransferase
MAESQSQRLTFREMTLADLEDVLSIESRAYAFPWSRGIFSDCLNAGHDCRVLCRDTELVGHAVLSTAAGESHLLNVCINRDLQGSGYGRLFVRHLIMRAGLLGAGVMFLEVRPNNKVALALYESLGFAQVGRRPDYYPGELGREDALVLALDIESLANSKG